MATITNDTLRARSFSAACGLVPWISRSQMRAIRILSNGEEGAFYLEKLVEMDKHIQAMPVTYTERDKQEHAVISLHYFYGGSDWYIIEKDIEGGVSQAWGFAILNGDGQNAETGYISITELIELGVELDLYFTPITLATARAKHP